MYSGINPHSYTVFSLTSTCFNPLSAEIDEIISVDVSKLPFSHTEIAEPVGTSLPPLSLSYVVAMAVSHTNTKKTAKFWQYT